MCEIPIDTVCFGFSLKLLAIVFNVVFHVILIKGKLSKVLSRVPLNFQTIPLLGVPYAFLPHTEKLLSHSTHWTHSYKNAHHSVGGRNQNIAVSLSTIFRAFFDCSHNFSPNYSIPRRKGELFVQMSGCIDQIACSCNVDWDGRRNWIASVVAGALFFSAWWIVLDTAMVVDKKDWTNVGAPSLSSNLVIQLYFILTISSSVAMVLLNAVSNSQVRGDSMNESVLGVTGTFLFYFQCSCHIFSSR